MTNTTASNEETLKFDLYISNTEDDTFKLEDLPEYTYSAVSTLRSQITAMTAEILTAEVKNPQVLKIVGGVLADSPLTAVGIALSVEKEGVLQATITGITSSALATTICVTMAAPVITAAGTTLGLSAAATFGLGLIATGVVGFLVDKGTDWLYEKAEKKLGEFLYNEDSKTVTINTDLADINDINSLLEPIYQCSIEESDNIKDIVVNQDVNGEENTYVIKPGDTVWALAQRYGLTPEEMVELNPWLGERFSPDGSYALIRPGEPLLIPGGKSPIVQKLGDTFTEAEEVTVPRDPLLIDLDGDGIETTTVENGVYFDHESDGFAELSAWVGKDDGILVYDKNGNGQIDNGNEVFGDNYKLANGNLANYGLEVLKEFDSNSDGKIDSNDENFESLQILKGDGSLLSLSEAGIESINLEFNTQSKTDANGNMQKSSGSYTKTDGTNGVLGDFLLQQDTTNSIATEWLEVSEEIAELPDIPGMGEMYSLHQAMARDEELTELVKAFENAADVTERQSLVIQIIYKWAGTEDVASDSRGTEIDAKDLVALEKFIGRTFDGERGQNPTSYAAAFLNNGFAILRDYVYSELTSQTFLKPIYQMLELEYNEDLQKYVYNLDNVQNYIDETIEKDLTSGRELLLDFTKTFINLGLQETSNYQDFEQHYIEMGDDFKLLMQSADKVNIYGTESDDTIDGTAQQEAVFGYNGNDTIYTRQGDDLVYGGDGNDVIDTCEGNDVIYGESGNDTINSGNGDDIIYGGEGNDTITNSSGNDTIYGDAGDDIIKSSSNYQNPSDETLIGGTGNDTFEDKDVGDETFIFNKGDGKDVILNRGGNDTIKFGEGITLENIKFHGEGSDLFITFADTDDSIQIESFISSTSYRIENFEFSDGTKITSDYVMEHLVTEGTDADDTITGTSASESIKGYQGNDTINSGNGDDIIYGGEGNDTITNSRGNDTIYGDAGDDIIKSSSNYQNPSDETLIGGTGNDTFEDKDAGDETFVFNKGDGNDVISNFNGNDLMKFGEGITLDNIKFHGEGSDLFITFADTDDSIQIKSFISSTSYRIENFEFSDGTKITSDYVMEHLVTEGTDADDTITGTSAAESIYGYSGNDSITSTGGDYIYGGTGNDTIITEEKYNEIIVGGAGNDYSEDEDGGDETYIFNRGDGSDVILNRGGNDTIKFGEGITKENLKFNVKGNDLYITFKDSADSILITSFVSTTACRIENLVFADGSVLTSEDILTKLIIEGTSGDDIINGSKQTETIYGYSGNDTIDANKGNDIIYGEAGDDTIESGEGDDIVYGGDGNDTITNTNGNDIIYGGAGDDTIKLSSASVNGKSETIIGGTGNDYFEDRVDGDEIFIFNKGDGNDVIYNYKGNDTIKFGEGIIPENIKFSGIKNDLYITFTDSDDSIQIKSFFSSDSYRIEKLEFTDGTFITSTDILSMIVTEGTSEGDTIIATNVGETIYGHEGDDTIDADEGNDIVYGGAGNDTIESGYGDDTVYGGDGNDTITNSRGNDTIYGGAGDDSIKSTSSNSYPTNETLIGGAGNDTFEDRDTGDETFIFNKGDGSDNIYNYGGNDTMKFGEGISLENTKFHGEGSDLFITFSDSDDSIQIENFISSDSYRIENVEFTDGTKITSDYVMEHLVTEGTDSDDNITGTKVNETIYGYGGDDTISSGYGDDTVYGGDGDDTITNSRGNDTIYGGAGDDLIKSTSSNSNPTNEILIGGTGNDTFQDSDTGDETFIFNKGDGNDVITNYNGNDTIKFGEGISLENIKFHGEGNNLFITFADSDDSIQIKSFISSDSYKIENFEFTDGTKITSDYVMEHLVTEGNDGDDNITGTKVNETIYGYGGDDTINSGYGDDMIYGGDGDDTITNSRGNDTIYGGAGDDLIKSTSSNSYPTNETLIGGTGNDTFQDSDTGNETFIFNEGDGSDSIYNYGGNDTIRFENSVSKEDIALFMDKSGDLFIDYGEDAGSDVIQIENQNNSNYAIESFELVDDTGATQMLTSEDINKIIQDMSAYAADNGISISSVADVKENPDLMNIVANSLAA